MSEERTITIDDVARLAGVSRATAGRVVGNYGSVSDKAKERVLEAVRQLDYQPNLIARGLRSQSTKTIAVVIGSNRNTSSTAGYTRTASLTAREWLIQVWRSSLDQISKTGRQ